GRLEHQAVDAPQEGRERLAAAGRRQNEGRLALRDRRPTLILRRRGPLERVPEPFPDGWLKESQDVRSCRHTSILRGLKVEAVAFAASPLRRTPSAWLATHSSRYCGKRERRVEWFRPDSPQLPGSGQEDCRRRQNQAESRDN